MEYNKLIGVLIVTLILAFKVNADDVSLSVDIDISINNCGVINDAMIVKYQNNYCQSSVVLPNLLVQVDIDALHITLSGLVYFSVKSMTTINGLTIQSNDIVLYDGGTYSIWKTAASMGIPTNANIDAISIVGNDVYLSTSISFSANNLTFHPSTIIKYNQDLSIFKSFTDLGLTTDKNIDALHIHNQDEIYYSLDTIDNSSNDFLARAEIAQFKDNLTTEYFSTLNQSDNWYLTNVDALHINTDFIFKNGFDN